MRHHKLNFILTSIFALSISAFAEEKNNWTGPYVGVDAGYTWARDSNIELETSDGTPNGYTATNKPQGGLIGINAGYNYLVNDKWLLGLGAEFKTYNANNTSRAMRWSLRNILYQILFKK